MACQKYEQQLRTIVFTLLLLIRYHFLIADATDVIQRHTCGDATSPLQLLTQSSNADVIYAAGGLDLCRIEPLSGAVKHQSVNVTAAKVLLEDPNNSDNVLFCGISNEGQCQILHSTDLTLTQTISEVPGYASLGSSNTVFALFSNAGYLSGETKKVLYVAQEKSSSESNVPVLSSRELQSTSDEFQIDVIRESDDYGSYVRKIDVSEMLRGIYSIRYIYGFTFSKFVYFVTVQRVNLDMQQPYTTHLARVCKNDDSYYSYAEIELQCSNTGQFDSTRLAIHGIAEAAYFHDNSDDASLYVVFGKGGSESDINLGSVVCKFPMHTIQDKFHEAFTDCYDGKEGIYLLPWFHESGRVPCEEDEFVKREIEEERPDFCYDINGTNQGVGHGYYIVTKELISNFTENLGFMTSIVVQQQNDVDVVVLGTKQGKLHKIAIRPEQHNVPYKTISLVEDSMDGAVGRSMLLNNGSNLVHAIVQNQVISVNISSCGLYTDCVSCVTTDDPLQCGWCAGRCTTQRECDVTPYWAPDSCPPLVDKVEPATGPLEGGTHVTIEGSHFGNWSAAPEVQITIGDKIECRVMTKNDSKLTCETEGSESPVNGSVFVATVAETGDTTSLTDSATVFQYRDVQLKTITPLKGPRSGGTEVVVTGLNLNVGSSLNISVADIACKIKELSAEKITCVTSPVPSTSQHIRKRSLPEGHVIITIDKTVRQSESVFIYKEDPEIQDIYPRKSIVSGGIVVTALGNFLDSVDQPRIVIETKQGNERHVEACTPNNDGTQMFCVTPALNISLDEPSRSAERQLTFKMDGVSDLNDFPKAHPDLSEFLYYVDPKISELEAAEKDLRLSAEEDHLEIKGENLDLGASISDYRVTIGDDPCEVTNLFPDKLYCKLDNEKHSTENGVPKDVRVEVGNLHPVMVYYLHYPKKVITRAPSTAALGSSGIAGLVSLILIVVFVAIIVSVVFYRKRQKKNKSLDVNTNNLTVRYRRDRAVDRPHQNNDYVHRQGSTETGADNGAAANAVPDDMRKLLEATDLLIDSDDLMLLEEIGKGHFGCVYRGLLKFDNKKEEQQVAVKTIKTLSGQTTDHEIHNFMEEALRMKDFQHMNVLRLLGIAIDKNGGLPVVVLPFIEHGDLLSYLRDGRNKPSVKILLEFGLDIAHGMDYLANLKFVHRDLAARNCMLDEDLKVLVADFGLSRDIYETQYYSSSDKQAKLPIKWMAPESLEKSVYDVRTDVWSYGVVLWELMTRGNQPYPGVDNWDITKYLACGRRLEQPEYCPSYAYEIMLRCWHKEPYARPTFAEIANLLQTKIQEADRSHSELHDELYANVPNTQSYVERATSGGSVFPPPPLNASGEHQNSAEFAGAAAANNAPVQDNADDYLTPSEHYYPRQEMTSQYLTSPPKDAEKERAVE